MSFKNNDRFVYSTGEIEQDFEFTPGTCIHYISKGQWSLHELISWLLHITGPADVMVTSFSLSETAIRSFLHLIDAGLIKSLKCLFDISTKKNKFDLLMFAQQVSGKIYLNTNHSKLILIENDQHRVIIQSSANLTVNRRFEAGAIFVDHHLSDRMADALKLIFQESILLNPDGTV